jgi:hypothetical protein
MTVSRALLVRITAGVILITAILLGWNWHYCRYEWPDEIQVRVLGTAVAGAEDLVSYERFSAYGEGAFRWTYRIAGPRQAPLAKYCKGNVLDGCRITKTKRLNEGVVQSVTYVEGTLIVEEIWE